MSNRYMDKNRYSFLKETVDVFADVKIGAAGTATLISHIPGPTGLDVTASVAAPGFQGVYNIVGPSGGLVTFNMQDAYYRLVQYNYTFINAFTGSNPVFVSSSQNVTGSVPGKTNMQVKLAFVDLSGNLTNPASGSEILFKFEFQNKGVI